MAPTTFLAALSLPWICDRVRTGLLRASEDPGSAAYTLELGKSRMILVLHKVTDTFTNVWMHGDHEAIMASREFIRRSRDVVRSFTERFNTLYSYLPDPDPRLIRLLEWLGFTVEKEGAVTYAFLEPATDK